MNETHESVRRDRGSLFADPGRMAPTIDKTWRDAFILELRLLGVSGDQIGDALVTAESHVRDSAESAEVAFGDPTAYAREIAANRGDEGGWQVGSATVVSVSLGLIGMLASSRAFSSWLDDETIAITAGDLLGWGVLLILMGLFLARLDTILRSVVQHFWLALVAPVALVATIVALLVLFTRPVLDVSWPPVAGLGAIALLVSAVTSWRETAADDDEIVAPGESPSPSLAGRASSALVLPALTALMLLFSWAVSRVG